VRLDVLCAELEDLEAQLDELITALENPELQDQERRRLEDDYDHLTHLIRDHQVAGHSGKPCFEE
jgi:hypothetical protein